MTDLLLSNPIRVSLQCTLSKDKPAAWASPTISLLWVCMPAYFHARLAWACVGSYPGYVKLAASGFWVDCHDQAGVANSKLLAFCWFKVTSVFAHEDTIFTLHRDPLKHHKNLRLTAFSSQTGVKVASGFPDLITTNLHHGEVSKASLASFLGEIKHENH